MTVVESGRDEVRSVRWVVAVAAGDRDALGELYRCYRSDVARWLRARLAWCPDDVEDLVQETFLLALEMAYGFDPAAWRVGAWLCRWVAPCVVHKFFRTDRFAQRAAVEVAVDALRRGRPEPAEVREARPVSARVVTALARLTPRQRRAMQLRYLDGLSCEAAARVAGTSANAIAAHCRDARRRLRVELADLTPAHPAPLLADMAKKSALGVAFAAVGRDAHAALGWLRDRGVRVNTSYAYAQARAARAAIGPAVDNARSTTVLTSWAAGDGPAA